MAAAKSKARDHALKAAGLLTFQRQVDRLASEIEQNEHALDKLREEADRKKRAIERRRNPAIMAVQKKIANLRSELSRLETQTERSKDQVDQRMQPAIDANADATEKLDRQKTEVHRKILAKILNIPLGNVADNPYRLERDIDEAISDRQQIELDNILAASKRGRRIVALREEKENLLDTVWLATSPKQIKELWDHVSDLLDSKTTRLQQDAQSLDPVEAE